MLQLKQLPSSNFGDRGDAVISMLVLHYTGMQSAKEALDRLCDAKAEVSAHYVVDEDGSIYQLVDESNCAWHAGVSYWRGKKNINNISIGIEIVNPGHEFGYRNFPAPQMQAVASLCSDIIARHKITTVNVVGHSDVAPLRKSDPGELFDWQWLAGKGIGLWPKTERQYSHGYAEERSDDLAAEISRSEIGGSVPPLKKLQFYGYEIPPDEASLPKVITAFQRHFRPKNISGIWDSECDELLAALLEMI